MLRRKLKHKLLQQYLDCIDPLNDSRFVHPDPVHHGQHSFPHAFRVAQTRLMLLSIVHGLKPKVRLKEISEGCANHQSPLGLNFGVSCCSLSKDFFLPNCVHKIHTHHQLATEVLHWLGFTSWCLTENTVVHESIHTYA